MAVRSIAVLVSSILSALAIQAHAQEGEENIITLSPPAVVFGNQGLSSGQFYATGPGRVDVVDLGQGVNSFSGNLAHRCVTGTVDQPPEFKTEARHYILQARNYQELQKIMSVSASASVSGGAGSIRASAKYSENSTFKQEDTYLVVRTVVAGSTVRLRDVRPDLSWFSDWTADNNDFFRMCGTKYISTVDLGGIFTAIVKVHSSSALEAQKFRARVEASGYGAKGDVEYARELRSLLQTEKKEIEILQSGSNGEFSSVEVDALINYGLAFRKTVTRDTAYPLFIHLSDYSKVFPKRPSLSAQERRAMRWAEAVIKMQQKRSELRSYIRDLSANGTAYRPLIGLPDAERRVATIDDQIEMAKKEYDGCVQAPASRCLTLPIPDTKVEVPQKMQGITISYMQNTWEDVGVVPMGETRTVEILGTFRTGYKDKMVPATANDTMRIMVDRGGRQDVASYRSLVNSGGTVIQGPAIVRVNLNDDPAKLYDNLGDGFRAVLY